MNHKKDKLPFDEIKALASHKLNAYEGTLSFYSWPHRFSNTAGPRTDPNIISGQAFTEFQIYGFVNQMTGERIKYCSGIWKEWDGEFDKPW